ncbi:MAG: hypothetical protein JKY01_07205 [Pseudomonadales bacterium]|nr:hypothetical protein [Pseudomonadales bacterium]
MRNLIISLVAVIMITGVGKVLAEPRPPVLLGEKYTVKYFDFEDINQLSSLTRWGDDPSLLENGYLRCPVGSGLYKGLGKKLFFIEGDETPSIQNLSNRNNERPISATMEFDLWLDETFQKNGADNEAGKFSGFEGIYDQQAGWGGKKVTDEHQNSWSVRIAHGKENAEGQVPIGLYVYHPGMPTTYGTAIDPKFSLKKQQFYNIKLYIKLNDIGESNGILVLSVDGHEIYRGEAWLLRTHPDVRIVSAWLDVYIGGTTPSKQDTYVLMDNLKISY